MLKKFGICFIVISVVISVFCGSVFASSEVTDNGATGGWEYGWFPSRSELVTIWNTSNHDFKITNNDAQYLFVMHDGLNNKHILASDKPFYGMTAKYDSQFYLYSSDKPFDRNSGEKYCLFTYNKDFKCTYSSVVYAGPFNRSDLEHSYGSHSFPYDFGNDDKGFFEIPQWTLETVVKNPLQNLMSVFGKDSLIVLKAGLIIFASLLGIGLLQHWVKSLI